MERKTLRVGMLGFGTVGQGVPLLLTNHGDKIETITGTKIELGKVFVRNIPKYTAIGDALGVELTNHVADILDDESIDVVIEVMGGLTDARKYIMKALEKGKHVITANKDLIALHGEELVTYARNCKRRLLYEASVAGGIPILRTISESFVSDEIEAIYGIVNGTTNFMLSQMTTNGLSYTAALERAQEKGFAESDPTNDVDGIDAAYKMIILTQFAFGMTLTMEDVDVTGIRRVTQHDIKMALDLGYRMKLIGSSIIKEGRVSVEVSPVMVSKHIPLAHIDNEMNAIYIKSHGIGESMYSGPGAGKNPTATSVVSDLVALTTDTKQEAFNSFHVPKQLSEMNDVVFKYYVSLSIKDEPGMFFNLTEVLTKHGISLEQIIQKKETEHSATVTLITHDVTKQQFLEMLTSMNQALYLKVNTYYRVLE